MNSLSQLTFNSLILITLFQLASCGIPAYRDRIGAHDVAAKNDFDADNYHRMILARAAARHAEHDLAGAAELYATSASEFPFEKVAWDGMGIVLFQQVS
jgi:hypothetical protein